jgi:hypothetical protein
MTWVTWRQYRYQAALAAALFAVVAVILIITGLHAAWVWDSALSRCTGHGSCAGLAGSGLSLGSPLVGTLAMATAAVPALPGLFWGAPAVAHELEAGTHQFAWTQGVTRRRWLAVRAGWLVLAAAVLAGAVSAVVSFWARPFSALDSSGFQLNHFDITGIVPVGYAVFALALGLCAGTVLRRTLPALAVTAGLFAGLRVVIASWLRPHYLTPVTVSYSLLKPFTPAGSYLGVSQGFITPGGKPSPLDFARPNFNGVPLPAACLHAMSASGSPQGILACVAAHGYRGTLSYQPADRFWAFQGIETGIFLVLAAVLVGVTFWVLGRRDA